MSSPPNVSSFDIFQGRFGMGAVGWVQAVEGLTEAKKRMEKIAAEKPGVYFVFSQVHQLIVAVADTTMATMVTKG